MAENTALTLAGIELNPEFPFMNAPGSVNGAGEENFRRDFMDIVRAPGAVAMVGSGTIPYKEGNEAKHGGPVYRHFKETGLTYNSMGLPNLGIDRFEEILPELTSIAHDHDKKLAFSLAPLTKNPGQEWVEMAEKALAAGVDIIEFNAGCPNIYDDEGNPKTVLSLEPDFMGEQLEYVQDQLGADFAAGLKLSPTPVTSFTAEAGANVDQTLMQRQAAVANRLQIVRYVAYFNTFGGQIPVDENGMQRPLSVPGGAGGVSGPGIAGVAHEQMKHMLTHLDDDMDVVVAGGISSGQDLHDRISFDPRLKLGSAVTALWEAPSLGAGATRIAEGYAAAV